MFNQFLLQSLFVEISMVSSMTFWSSLIREVRSLTLAISSWATSLTEATTQLRLSNSCSVSSSSIQLTLPFSEVIMRQDRLLLSMDSMTRPSESTVMPTPGSTAPKFSIILVSELLLKERFSASMVVFHQRLKLLTKSDSSKEEWKSLMKVPSVTWCGQTLKRLRPGLCLQEELDGFSDKKLHQNSTISMTLNWLPELINLLWTALSTGSRIKPWLLYGQLLTTATDAVTLLQSWISTKS